MAETERILWTMHGENVLDTETYPIPAEEELVASWQEYTGSQAKVVPAPGVFGAVSVPAEQPVAYASIDVCEVLRHTGLALRTVEENPAKTVAEVDCIHHYGEGLSVFDNFQVIQTLMNHDYIQPTEGIDEMADIVRGWRDMGVYTTANTSTLPGCELATIRFLGKYATGALDGIVFPRNYDGKSKLTKGIAERYVIEALGYDESKPLSVVHIDDVTHHNVNFRRAMQAVPNAQVATFQPKYPSCYPKDDGSTQTETPLEAFQCADEFLRKQLK